MSGAVKTESISVYNACEHNLKGINVDIPLEQFTCVTGPSGCGKSSLVFDTIYAESQRNFLESMSGNLYGQKLMDKPRVDKIENLKPALNVSQNYYNVNPRSTIGTISDISYYLRTVFALVYSQMLSTNVDMNYFSANNPSSCCTRCAGTGEEYVVREDMVIPDEEKSLANGGILFFKGTKTSLEYKMLMALCDYYGIDINKRVKDLTKEERDFLLYRKEDIDLPLRYKTPKGKYRSKTIHVKGAMQELYEKAAKADIPSVYASVSKYLGRQKCTACKGQKLKPEILDFRICNKNISDVEEIPLCDVNEWCIELLKKYKQEVYYVQLSQLIEEICKRVAALNTLDLGYLCVGRSIPTLSGGEIQRVRIANQVNCALNGLVYILDEPCKGLHDKNIRSLLDATRKLVSKGNTVISIEHNKKFISESNRIIELGPDGGINGGYLISNSKPNGEALYNIVTKQHKMFDDIIVVEGVHYHNLNGITADIPVGGITCITGVSGSGKSSLASVISRSCSQRKPVDCDALLLNNSFKRVLQVNQQPIGKTPRSTIVSYLGIYDSIRELFAAQKDALEKGLSASDFSMNVSGGRCEECQGTGKKRIELQYLAESYIECPICKGKRFNQKVLSVHYKDHNIDDVLNMPITEVYGIFKDNEKISTMLDCLIEIGLGYLSLGQMSMNLSGGEAQRIKLAKALGTESKKGNIYFLDEPTSGLNEKDIKKISKVLVGLSKTGNTIVIVEHNIEFIAALSDHIIDLGCIAGDHGGNTVIEGYFSDVAKDPNSSWFDYNSVI